ncbi:MAG: L-threonylcarbamoyladenylate synthase [Opitutaceae bacterium]
MAEILDDSPANIERLAKALLADRLVAVPTETVYGLAGNALSAEACAAIFEAKGRPAHDPLIVHLSDLDMLGEVAVPDPLTRTLAEAFWPGPLTLILKKRPKVPSLVTSGLETVAVRIPAHQVFQKLIAAARIPLAAPSANPFGYISPTTSAHVAAQLGDRIGFILEGGPCRIGIESTILDLVTGSLPRILRPGAVSEDQIRAVLGPIQKGPFAVASPSETQGLIAPGLLDRHYSPGTPLVLRTRPFASEELMNLPTDVAALCIQKPGDARPNIFWLSEDGDPREVARRLFSMLRDLDRAGFGSIEAEPMTDEADLGRAINDRLRRAAGRGNQVR